MSVWKCLLILTLGPCTPSLVTGSRYSDPAELPKLIIPSVIAFAILVVMVTAVMVYYCRKKRSLCDCVCCKRFYSRYRNATDVSAAGNQPKCDCVTMTTHPGGGGGPMGDEKAECPCARYNRCMVETENVLVWDHPGGDATSNNDSSSTSMGSDSSNTYIIKEGCDNNDVWDAYTSGRPRGKDAPIVHISNGWTHRNGGPLKSILKRKSQSLHQGAESAGLVSEASSHHQVALVVPTDAPKEEEAENVCPQCANKCQRCASKFRCLQPDSALPGVQAATPGVDKSITTARDHGTQAMAEDGSTLPDHIIGDALIA